MSVYTLTAILLSFASTAGGAPWTYIGLACLVFFSIAAHNEYKRAKVALAAQPGLRGRWYLENAWWVLTVPLAVALMAWIAYAWYRISDLMSRFP